MATHAPSKTPSDERLQLGDRAKPLTTIAMVAGVVGLVLTIIIGSMQGDHFRRFYFSYLTSFMYFLSLGLGALFFVLIQFLARVGWSVSVRRIAEVMASILPVLGLLSLPIFVSVVTLKGDLFPWALPMSAAVHEEGHAEAKKGAEAPAVDHVKKAEAAKEGRTLDEETLVKRAYLNPTFFVIRLIFYFVIWSVISVFYLKQSGLQDSTRDIGITAKLQAYSAPSLILLGLTLTGAAFDLIMSLDPHWYSTMFGVYYFAGSAVSFFAVLILFTFLLQRAGFLKRSIDIEHYHDMGKFLFAFTFFWGYIAFSQYMLLWYANIPEEIEWFARHGATTVKDVVTGNVPLHYAVSGWSAVIVALLFGQLLIPFGGLLSRHVKRKTGVLVFWAVWILVLHFVDMYWLIMPQYAEGDTKFSVSLMDFTALIGIGGVFVFAWLRTASKYSLRPLADPRLSEALAFENF